MLFSIIIPAYNAEKSIEQCVKSVLSQDFPRDEFEIIVVDDCSPDNQNKVINALCTTFSDFNIRLICHTENLKQGGARNTGIREALGEWIFFLDSDDYWTRTDVLKVFASEILRFPEVSIIESISHVDVPQGKIIIDNKPVQIEAYITTGIDFFCNSGRYDGWVWNAAYRKKIIDKFFFRERCFFEDTDWKLNITFACPQMLVTDYPFYAYASNPQSTIRSMRKDVFQAYIDANRIILHTFLNHPVDNAKDKVMLLVKRNIFSCFKMSKDYTFKDSYDVLNRISSTELFNLSNYTLSIPEKIALLSLQHFTFMTILSVRIGVYSRRFLRKLIGKRYN